MKPIVNYNEIISHLQIEKDEALYNAYISRNEIFQMKTLINVNYFLDFDILNWWSILIPLITDFEILNFIVENNSQLKRNMTFAELYNFSMDFRLIKQNGLEYPKNFNEFKQMYSKIKTANK